MKTPSQNPANESATQLLRQAPIDRYLRDLRRSLRGAPAAIAAEVEAEIVTHILEAMLAGAPVHDVLDQLGAPEAFAREMARYQAADSVGEGLKEGLVPEKDRTSDGSARDEAVDTGTRAWPEVPAAQKPEGDRAKGARRLGVLRKRFIRLLKPDDIQE